MTRQLNSIGVKTFRPRPLVLVLLISLTAAVLLRFGTLPVNAVVEIDITKGNLQPLAIAIPAFGSAKTEDAELGEQIAEVVLADLERSGLFQPIDKAAFLQKSIAVNKAPRFGDWRIINAQALVVGKVERLADGRLKAEFRLWDIIAGNQLIGQQFYTRPSNWRRIGHIIADAVYQRLTGENGYFDTRIVFVDETGPKDARQKRLAMMDQDGQNLRFLTDRGPLVLTPRFSPSSQEITYLSYENDQPRVYLLNIESGQREIVGDFPGMSFAPRFSPDGHTIIMSRQQAGYSNIYSMDLRSRALARLTQTQAIDTAPCYSPDGKQIVFESDRAGSRQLYMMQTDGSDQRRISKGDGRYSTPVWSPRGDLIAFTKQLGGQFLIGVMRPDGSDERILTEGYHNEGPTWSPNGRVLMFFRESRGKSGGPKLYTIDLTGYNERLVATPSFGSDPAWSPLVN